VKLKEWAVKTLQALRHHLEMAEALNKETVRQLVHAEPLARSY